MILTLIFTAVSGVLTALTLLGGVSLWWLLPLWVGYYLAVALVYLIVVVGGLFLFLPKADPSPSLRRFTHGIMKLTLRWVLVLIGLRVTVSGADKLPDTPYLLVGNHRSAFDPIATVAALSSHIVFVAKPGVLKIPVIGSILGRLCFMGIDRENARNAVTTIKRAAELIKDVGITVGIYPEGTRSKDGNLLPFHAGSFKIAKLAGCPVAVVTTRVTKGLIFPSKVELHVVDVMDETYVTENGTAQMTDRAEAVIREDLSL